MSRYSHAAKQGRDGESIVNEFKQMVKECHRRGIEVLLDVVFNHTAEGNEQGLSLSFRYVVLVGCFVECVLWCTTACHV